MKWYKRDPDAFKGGTIGLTLEEVGAYCLILDDLYARDGNVPNDIRYLCRLLHCNPRVVRRVLGRLFELGKLRDEDGKLLNGRAQRELKLAHSLIETMMKLGQSSARKRKKNNGATPTGPSDTSTSTTRDLSVGEDRVCLERRDPPLLRDPPLPPKPSQPRSLASALKGALAHSADEPRYPPRYKSDNVLQPLPERLNGGW